MAHEFQIQAQGHSSYLLVDTDTRFRIYIDAEEYDAIKLAESNLHLVSTALGSKHQLSINVLLSSVDLPKTLSELEVDTVVCVLDADGDMWLRLYGRYDGFDWIECSMTEVVR
jgi:hypothetical protein